MYVKYNHFLLDYKIMNQEITKILVVDDDKDICQSLELVLNATGRYNVYIAFDGEAALKLLKKYNFPLLITDLMMPKMSGLELICQAHKLDPQLMVIIFTGYATMNSVIEAMRVGVYDYLPKPINFDLLKRTISHVLEKYYLRKEKEKLLERLQVRDEEREALIEISRLITRTLDLDKLLYNFVEQLKNNLHFNQIGLWLVESDGKVLVGKVGSGKGMDNINQIRILLLDSNVLSGIVHSGQSCIIDIDTNELQLLHPALQFGEKIALVPVVVHSETIGLISTIYTDDDRQLTNDTLISLMMFAELVGAAFQNARLFDETKQRANMLAMLYNFSNIITSNLDLDKLLSQLVEIINSTFGYLLVGILLKDDDKYISLRVSNYELNISNIRLRIGIEGVCGWVAYTGKPLLVDDVSKDPRYICTLPEIKSALAVPLLVENEILGVLSVESDKLAAFSRQDMQLLMQLANQVSIVIVNAKLYSELQTSKKYIDNLIDNSGDGIIADLWPLHLMHLLAEIRTINFKQHNALLRVDISVIY